MRELVWANSTLYSYLLTVHVTLIWFCAGKSDSSMLPAIYALKEKIAKHTAPDRHLDMNSQQQLLPQRSMSLTRPTSQRSTCGTDPTTIERCTSSTRCTPARVIKAARHCVWGTQVVEVSDNIFELVDESVRPWSVEEEDHDDDEMAMQELIHGAEICSVDEDYQCSLEGESLLLSADKLLSLTTTQPIHQRDNSITITQCHPYAGDAEVWGSD